MSDQSPFPGNGGDVQRLKAEALGEPGQRRFRIVVAVLGETFIIWMEKQQMQALGIAIDQVLRQVTGDAPLFDGASVPIDFDEDTSNQFRLGRVELGYEETGEHIIINAYDIQDDESGNGLTMRLSRSQARELVQEAAALAAAGRPICPMCGSAMDPSGHVCPEQNGHLPLPKDDTLVDTE
ncbi:MAG TPA: DUF3090 family protein [Thermomicrobiales bacterium]|nr:DUF3090 family protein [Thermomicrobiales bacterium]